MAISDKLTKLTTDITDAYTAVDNKGGTIPTDKNTENLPAAINSITGGGPSRPTYMRIPISTGGLISTSSQTGTLLQGGVYGYNTSTSNTRPLYRVTNSNLYWFVGSFTQPGWDAVLIPGETYTLRFYVWLENSSTINDIPDEVELEWFQKQIFFNNVSYREDSIMPDKITNKPQLMQITFVYKTPTAYTRQIYLYPQDIATLSSVPGYSATWRVVISPPILTSPYFDTIPNLTAYFPYI